MTAHPLDDLASMPLTATKNKDMPGQAVSSIESSDINVYLDGYADIYYSLEKQIAAGVKNAIAPNSVAPDKGPEDMTDLVQYFDTLWPPEEPAGESVAEISAKNNSDKSHSKVKHGRNLK